MTCRAVEDVGGCKDGAEEAKRHHVVHDVLTPPMGARGDGPGCRGRRRRVQVEDAGEIVISCMCEARQRIGRVGGAP